MDTQREHPGIIAPPPLIFASALIIGLALDALYPVYTIPAIARAIAALVTMSLGVLCAMSAFSVMRALQTSPNPYRATKAIATAGVFRITRNPLYVALTLFYLGISFALNAPLALMPLPIALWVINKGVIDREEKYLTQKFGEEYLNYKARVRRWL